MEKVGLTSAASTATSARTRERMSRRKNLAGLCAIAAVCIVVLYASQRYTSNNYSTEYFRPRERTANQRILNSHNKYYGSRSYGGSSGTSYDSYPSVHNSSISIEDVLNYQRVLIEASFDERSFAGEKLKDLTPETDGRPRRSIIITTWRSGSTFLGDILNALPGNYYHYEPLLDFDIVQIRGPPNDSVALHNLRHLLRCNYNEMENYLDFGRTHNYLFSHNTRLWQQCLRFPQFCYDPKFLGPFCQLFPLQSMKVVRLRAALVEPLLEDESLNVRVVLLIRDPRGSLQSRRHRVWCPDHPDCYDPVTVCDDMQRDYEAAIHLSERFPKRFLVIRYEDLSLDTYGKTKEILDFYGLPFHPEVKAFLDTHTTQDIGGVSSTYRDSKSAPFHWTKELTFDYVQKVQESCVSAMRNWGYRNATSERELYDDFNPLLKYRFS
ncbi:carbohydrate sulfotransferase 5-like [Anopheles ziemanni]|uniref:carbohydrate sulfotransferase 5-like n=1 Tax=Anopheles coustani TaxID=139045 RepID=UPI00265A3BEF|nr:carbohydrate sulfotransferase 5-like [Anopheles coustani]XP_058176704.1 carbohydrate sulfotransferase 5-like [Anopheles ziemanni]